MLDTMMWSTLRGSASGGLDDLASGAFANTGSPSAAPTVEYETKLSARVDGQQRSGMLVMHKAVNEAVSKAQQHGVGLVGMRNVGSTTGAVGYYLETIANSGLAGLVPRRRPLPAAAAAAAAARRARSA